MELLNDDKSTDIITVTRPISGSRDALREQARIGTNHFTDTNAYTERLLTKLYVPPTQLDSVSIILPVINETVSLRQSVEIIMRDVKRELIREFIIVVCKRTTPEAMAVIAQLQKELGELVVVLDQKLPFLGGALRDAFDVARGSHVIIMGSDLETNPDDAHILIAEEQKVPSGIVTTSRWIRGGEFHGYSPIKLLCNWI